LKARGRYVITSALLFVFLQLLLANVAFGRVYVHGYFRSNGTYVRPYYRTNPDGNPYNNYGFPGNYNPNTGKVTSGAPDAYLRRYYSRQTSGIPAAPVEDAAVGPEAASEVAAPLASAPPVDGARPCSEIVHLQEALSALGFNPGVADGLCGSETRSAIKAYQQSKGWLTVDGIAGPMTRTAIVLDLVRSSNNVESEVGTTAPKAHY